MVYPLQDKPPRYIFNVPTKIHWRDNSDVRYIQFGLSAIVRHIKERKIQSIAIPPLGCGCGGLDWVEVRAMMKEAFEPLRQVNIVIYGNDG